jgi:hypothetical protein
MLISGGGAATLGRIMDELVFSKLERCSQKKLTTDEHRWAQIKKDETRIARIDTNFGGGFTTETPRHGGGGEWQI